MSPSTTPFQPKVLGKWRTWRDLCPRLTLKKCVRYEFGLSSCLADFATRVFRLRPLDVYFGLFRGVSQTREAATGSLAFRDCR